MGSDSRKRRGISRRSLAHQLLQWQTITQTLGVVWNLFGPSRRRWPVIKTEVGDPLPLN